MADKLKVDMDVKVWQVTNSAYHAVLQSEAQAGSFPIAGPVELGTFSKYYEGEISRESAPKALQQIYAVTALLETYQGYDNLGVRTREALPLALKELATFKDKLEDYIGIKTDMSVEVWQLTNSAYYSVLQKEATAGNGFKVTGPVEMGTFSDMYGSNVTPDKAPKALEQVRAVKDLITEYAADPETDRFATMFPRVLNELTTFERKLETLTKERPDADVTEGRGRQGVSDNKTQAL